MRGVPLEQADVEVWYWRTEGLTEIPTRRGEEILSPEELERMARFRTAEDRRDFAAGHVLLRRALSRCGSLSPGEWRFSTREHGKPELDPAQAPNRSPQFSLSHTRGIVACAVAGGVSVGIDVERVRLDRCPLEIAERYFSQDEWAQLTGCAPAERAVRFTELWTLKEAYLKALGLGLQGRLDACAFTLDGSGLGFTGPSDPEQWRFWLAQVEPDVRIAVAAHGECRSENVRFHDASPRSSVRETHFSLLR